MVETKPAGDVTTQVNQSAIPFNVVTNEKREPLRSEVRKSTDLFHHADNSEHDRNTEKMGEWNRFYEDSHF